MSITLGLILKIKQLPFIKARKQTYLSIGFSLSEILQVNFQSSCDLDEAKDEPSATEEEALAQDGDEDESKEEAELEELLEEEEEEEEVYNPWPIAPDGKMMESDVHLAGEIKKT